LSDEEARRRGTQKTVLERRAPPTFDVLIEIQTRDRLVVHPDVALAVDAMLRGFPLPPEVRVRNELGDVRIEKPPSASLAYQNTKGFRRAPNGTRMDYKQPERGGRRRPEYVSRDAARSSLETIHVYPYGVARNRLIQAAKRLGVPANIVSNTEQADVLVTLKSYYRKRQRAVIDAEDRGMPVYVLRSNTVNQMQQFLSDLFNLSAVAFDDYGDDLVRRETQAAIDAVLNGERWIELQPTSSKTRRLQHQMARRAKLNSHSYGKEPHRRVRIFRE